MRYIDTGPRNPEQALGFWLGANVLQDPSITEIRWQSGFFNAASLGYFGAAFQRLQNSNGILRVLIGSNDGRTRRSDVKSLLTIAGSPRTKQQIGIVKFDRGYFHPKTVHITRDDGSSAAYVGSANLTGNGLAVHIEAGMLLDTREGDDAAILAKIASAVDWWLAKPRAGLILVDETTELDALVDAYVLDVPPPPRPQFGVRGTSEGLSGERLAILLEVPKILTGEPISYPPISPHTQASETASPLLPSTASERYSKRLTISDAQRKPSGNQRGSITLIKAGYPINPQTYFRYGLFKDATWINEITNTGEPRETTHIPMSVDFLGQNLGVLSIPVSYAPNREASQANYTSLLHLGPLSPYISAQDVTGKWLILTRHTDGSYGLST